MAKKIKKVVKIEMGKKPATKKTEAKKPVSKKAIAKVAVSKKPVAKKPVAIKPVTKKSAGKKGAVKIASKSPAKKSAAKKVSKAVTSTVKSAKKITKIAPAKPVAKPVAKPAAKPAAKSAAKAPIIAAKTASKPVAKVAKVVKKAAPVKASAPVKSTNFAALINKPAPSFSLLNTDGQRTNLADFAGKKVVLYFYPKDLTPGCTIEAEQFNTLFDEYANNNTVILGVSQDDCSSHQKFREKHMLKFSLLSDTDHGEDTGVSSLCQTYGVWGEKNKFGQKYWGINRTTFLINEDGTLIKVWENVKPEGHAQEVLEFIKSLS